MLVKMLEPAKIEVLADGGGTEDAPRSSG